MSRFGRRMAFTLVIAEVTSAALAASSAGAQEREKELDEVIAALGPRANLKELDEYWDKYTEEHEQGRRFSDYVYDRYRLRKNAGSGLVALTSTSFVVGFSMFFYSIAESADENPGYLGSGDSSDDFLDEQASEYEEARLELMRKTGLAIGITGIALLPAEALSFKNSEKSGRKAQNTHALI